MSFEKAKYSIYEPVIKWVETQFQNHRLGRPFLFGLNAPQGAGKTTLGRELNVRLKEKGISFLSISIDDFYLSRSDQIRLAENHSDDPFLQKRGYPGTHDVWLGIQTLESLMGTGIYGKRNDLCQISEERNQGGDWRGRGIFIPRYDKSAYGGKGDRYSHERWESLIALPQVVMLEGWMLGYQCKDSLAQPELFQVNELLKSYKPWWDFLDSFVQLKIEEFEWVVQWRAEAEEAMKDSGKSGMSSEEVTRYAKSFLPAYKEYSNTLKGFASSFQGSLVIPIGKDRCGVDVL